MSLLTGIVNPKTVHNMDWLIPPLDYYRVHSVGWRERAKIEEEVMGRYSVRHVSSGDVHRYGMARVVHGVLSEADRHWNAPLHLSFSFSSLDASICDNAYAPPGRGLSKEDALLLFQRLRETKRLVGIDLVDLNPKLGDPAKLSDNVEFAIQLLETALVLFFSTCFFFQLDFHLLKKKTPLEQPILPPGYHEYVEELRNKVYWHRYPTSWIPPTWEKKRGSDGRGDQELTKNEKKVKLLTRLRSEGRQEEYKRKISRRRWKRNVKAEKKFKKSAEGRRIRASGQDLKLRYLKKW